MKHRMMNSAGRTPSARLLLAAFAGLAGACGTPGGAPRASEPERLPDASEGAADDAPSDSPAKSGADAGQESVPDADRAVNLDAGAEGPSDSGAEPGPDAGSESDPDGSVASTGEGSASVQIVTSTEVVTMTRDEFAARCEGAGGALEVHPHCGGVNTCRGFSYDLTISTFTEHTCRGLNTCTGYSCVVPSDP